MAEITVTQQKFSIKTNSVPILITITEKVIANFCL